jgi:DNA helicase II / ATP-dependent DNA helicase PcrA
MVGGFSFYERAEIKDLLSYLRLVRNPHDSMALQRVINTPARGIGATTLATLERLALETGVSTWDAIGAAISNRLIPARALMALESFRQLILDAQAMMDPDFAGKLTADVASDEATAGDTDFSFGAGEPSDEEKQQLVDQLEAATSFDFGGNENQIPLLDASHFSPFAAEPKRPFLKMPKAKTETRVPQVPVSGPGKNAADDREPDPDQPETFRKPGDAARFPSSFASSSIARATSKLSKPRLHRSPSAGLRT